MRKWLLVMICGVGVAAASEHPKADATMAECDAHVAKLRAEFAQSPASPDDAFWVKNKLQHMVTVDQYVRHFAMRDWAALGLSAQETLAVNREIGTRMQSIDAANTADLKTLLAKHGWFTIGKFGTAADNNAWLLVQHADADPAFQREVLKMLEPLAAQGETQASNYAYLFDRVASSNVDIARRTPQRYGTQGSCTGPGVWEPNPVEDPDHLDERRRQVGLMPMADYRKVFKDICRGPQ